MCCWTPLAATVRVMRRPALLAADSDRVELGVSVGSLKDFYFIAGRAKAGIGEDGGMDDMTRRRWIRLFAECDDGASGGQGIGARGA